MLESAPPDENFIEKKFQEIQDNRPTIEGMLILKRKGSWVRRYASIDGPGRTMQYKKNMSERSWKYSINLRTAKITKGLRNSTQPFISIEVDGKELEEIDDMLEVPSIAPSQTTSFIGSKKSTIFNKRKSGIGELQFTPE